MVDQVFSFFQWAQSSARPEFQRALDVARLRVSVMRTVSRAPSATRLALFWIALSTLCGAVGALIFPVHYKGVRYQPEWLEALGHALVSFAFIVGVVALVHFFARRLFEGPASFEPFLRVVGYGYVVGLFNLFPTFVGLVLVWVLLITGKALMVVHRLTLQQAVSTILLTLGVVGGLFFLMLGVNPSMLYGGFYLAPY